MSGIIGKKIGMTSLFNEEGKNIPCTVIQAGPCAVFCDSGFSVDGEIQSHQQLHLSHRTQDDDESRTPAT